MENQTQNGIAVGYIFVLIVAAAIFSVMAYVGAAIWSLYVFYIFLYVRPSYKILGLIACAVATYFVWEPVQVMAFKLTLPPRHIENSIYAIIQACLLSIPASAFYLTAFALDFVNDQREEPTSGDDLIAWRLRWGFTKGLIQPVADNREQHQGGQPSGRPGAFDVPPQDGAG